MRSSTGTLRRVPAQQKPPPDEHVRRLQALAKQRGTVMTELRAAVVAAMDAGGSVRTVANAAGISTASVNRWVREARS